MKKILLSWSSGKDSAWTLQVLRQRCDVEVAGLLVADMFIPLKVSEEYCICNGWGGAFDLVIQRCVLYDEGSHWL